VRLNKVIPKTDREMEQFYRDVITKLSNTDATLSDEEQKSSLPLIGMIHAQARMIAALERDGRNMRTLISSIERRLKDIEGEL
jgi:hypothetical protein